MMAAMPGMKSCKNELIFYPQILLVTILTCSVSKAVQKPAQTITKYVMQAINSNTKCKKICHHNIRSRKYTGLVYLLFAEGSYEIYRDLICTLNHLFCGAFLPLLSWFD